MLSPRSNANKIYAAAGEESKNGEKKPKNAVASLRSAYIKILTPEALAVAQEKSGKILSFHSSDGGDKRSKRLHSANGSVDLPFSEFDSEAAAQKLLERRAQFWIEKPIHCGYIHAFSMSEYNSENVKFLMAIVDFQEHLDLDSTAWNNGTWQEIDRRLGIILTYPTIIQQPIIFMTHPRTSSLNKTPRKTFNNISTTHIYLFLNMNLSCSCLM